MADTVFNTFKQFSLTGGYDLVTQPVRVVLLDTEPDIDTDIYYSDIAGNEITGVGYSTSGVELTSKTVGMVPASDVAYFDAADVNWPNSTLTASYAALFQVMGSATDSKLIGYIDFGSSISSQNGDFSIQWNGDGILLIRPTT